MLLTFLVCELNLSLYLKLFGKALCVSVDFKFSLLCVMGTVYFFTNLEILLIALPVGPVSFCGSITLDSLIEKETNTQVPHITLFKTKQKLHACCLSVRMHRVGYQEFPAWENGMFDTYTLRS